MTDKQIKQVIDLQNEMLVTYKNWRKGQSFFNALYTLFPNIGDKITASEYDPFYVDSKIEKCITRLKEL